MFEISKEKLFTFLFHQMSLICSPLRTRIRSLWISENRRIWSTRRRVTGKRTRRSTRSLTTSCTKTGWWCGRSHRARRTSSSWWPWTESTPPSPSRRNWRSSKLTVNCQLVSILDVVCLSLSSRVVVVSAWRSSSLCGEMNEKTPV